MKLKKSILYPVTDFSPYFNLCIRKTHKNTLLKYEVDWIYSFETKYCQEFKCHIKEV
jgi:hypothetical protein